MIYMSKNSVTGLMPPRTNLLINKRINMICGLDPCFRSNSRKSGKHPQVASRFESKDLKKLKFEDIKFAKTKSNQLRS